MINPKVSIITVTYNAEEVLERTLESIGNLKYDNVESIVVDGGSTDGTVEIIKKYGHVVTKWVSEKDDGIYYAMNKGLDMAEGGYVWFLNAGDTISKLDILNYIFGGENFERDIYYGQTNVVDIDGKLIGGRRLKAKMDITWKDFRWGMLICHQSILIKKSIAPKYDTNYKVAADYGWVLESLKRADSIMGTKHRFSNFLEGGFSSNNYLRANKERFAIMRKHYGLIPTIWYNILMSFRFLFTVTRLRRI